MDAGVPVKYNQFINEDRYNSISIEWDQSYSGQFDIWFGNEDKDLAKYKKTIVVESLF